MTCKGIFWQYVICNNVEQCISFLLSYLDVLLQEMCKTNDQNSQTLCHFVIFTIFLSTVTN